MPESLVHENPREHGIQDHVEHPALGRPGVQQLLDDGGLGLEDLFASPEDGEAVAAAHIDPDVLQQRVLAAGDLAADLKQSPRLLVEYVLAADCAGDLRRWRHLAGWGARGGGGFGALSGSSGSLGFWE